MNRKQLSQPITVGILLLFLVVGCGTATTAPTTVLSTPTPIPPTAPPVLAVPITKETNCWTVATVIDPGPPSKLGGTSIKVTFDGYSYRGIVGGGGFMIPTGGNIDKVTIAGKVVTLKTHDFGKGSIDTEEFGRMDVLFKANLNSECAILVATSEQLAKLTEWIR